MTETAFSWKPRVFAGARLGELFASLGAGDGLAPAGLVGTLSELHTLAKLRSKPAALLRAWRAFPRNAWNRAARRRHVANGLGLVAQLRYGLAKLGVPVWLDTELVGLEEQHGRVVGARVRRAGRELALAASRGVVLATGGFEHNEEMRRQFAGREATNAYTSGAAGNVGDGIRAGLALGAAVDLMHEAWWAPTFLRPGEKPRICIFERGKPGFVVVDAGGHRFTNEAQPYGDFVKAMQRREAESGGAIPAFMIFDQRYRTRYPLAGLLPGVTPRRDLESGFLVRADSLAELAKALGVDAAGLVSCVARFNACAERGKDEEFGRGDHAFDRYAGDANVRPNPCLAPLATPPYYGVRLYPGDLGTKGGLCTNEHGEVLRADGSAIAGLYAAGNDAASPLAGFYPGAGGTLGPAMTFAYLAARRSAASPAR